MHRKHFHAVYLDMDDTLAAMSVSLLALHGYPKALHEMRTNCFELEFNMATRAIWEPVLQLGATFWADLPCLPWAHELVAFAQQIAPTYILTRPLDIKDPSGRDVGQCVQGKLAWLYNHFPQLASRTIFTEYKSLLAQHGTLLIDDDANKFESDFETARGDFIVVPQYHNRFWTMQDDCMATIKAQYALLIGTDDAIDPQRAQRTPSTMRRG